MKRIIACLGLALALSGCASAGGPQVACRGAMAAPGATRTYALTAVGGGPEKAAIQAALERQLAAQGFTRTDEGAAYLVELLHGERPGQVGAYADLGQDGQPDWVVKPARAPWWRTKAPDVDLVTIRFVDARSGAEAYRASASSVSDAKRAAEAGADRFDLLVRAALQPCPAATGTQAAG